MLHPYIFHAFLVLPHMALAKGEGLLPPTVLQKLRDAGLSDADIDSIAAETEARAKRGGRPSAEESAVRARREWRVQTPVRLDRIAKNVRLIEQNLIRLYRYASDDMTDLELDSFIEDVKATCDRLVRAAEGKPLPPEGRRQPPKLG